MVAFYLPGGFAVYAFSVMLGLGAAFGLTWIAWRAPKQEALEQVNAGLWILFGGLVGGRALFVAVNRTYFQSHPLEILQVFQGGAAWPGALAGGLLALIIYANLAHMSLGKLADAMIPLATILTISVWLACWVDRCAYGPQVNALWGLPARDEWGILSLRFPTQLTGAILTFLTFWTLDWTRGGLLAEKGFNRPGQVACLGLIALCLQLFFLSLLRADPASLWAGLRLDAWAALGFAAVGAIVLFVSMKRSSETTQL